MEFNKYIRAVGLACLGALGSFQVAAYTGGVTTYRNSPTTPGNVERAYTAPAKAGPEFDATYQRTMRKAQTAAAASKALRGVLRTLPFVGTLISIAALVSDVKGIWSKDATGANVLTVPDASASACSVAPCYGYYVALNYSGVNYPSMAQACSAPSVLAVYGSLSSRVNTNFPPVVYCELFATADQQGPQGSPRIEKVEVAPVPLGPNAPRRTVSDAELEDMLKGANWIPAVLGDLGDKGIEIPWPAEEVEDMPQPLTLQPRTTTYPDGSKTIEQTRLRPYLGPDGKTINWERTTDVTQQTAPDASGRTTSTTTTTTSNSGPADAKKDDRPECEKSPDTLGCAKLDTPDGNIPKVDKNVSYSAESIFGSGSCPADRSVLQGLTGRPIVLSYAQTCDSLARYVQPLIIAIALYMAYLIILPGNRE